MKLQQLACVAGTALAILVSVGDKSHAATILLQNAALATPPAGASLFRESADGGLTKPGDVTTFNYKSGISNPRFAINDSAYNFTKFVYTILPGQDATWDPASEFKSFSNSAVSADGKTLTFSNGVFASGATAVFQSAYTSTLPTDQRNPVAVSLTFDGTSVPEPATIMGSLAAAGFGMMLKKKKLAAASKA
ncbi:MAG: PEP-CTERM sorting domain-containing protein [Gloeotrichia echinulata IR180]|jgi:hypothetical protein|nr:PEP-CTERM sorting domain-containing protein [Gloeotrichia echinulata DEX184]